MKDSHGILDSILGVFVPIHPDGYKFVAGAALVILLLFALAPPLGWLAARLSLQPFAYFFRDPERVTTHRKGLVVSAADGKLASIASARPASGAPLNNQNHSRASPCSSRCSTSISCGRRWGAASSAAVYVPGAFFNAELDKASEKTSAAPLSSRPRPVRRSASC